LAQPAPADASAYHARVRAAASLIPMRIDNWVGQDVPVPRSAVALLSPNVIVSRRYVNIADGIEASILLVQCTDARDIVAHYPPVCYCNAGWTMTGADPHDWAVGNTSIAGTRYHFMMDSFEKMGAMYVDDFMILPDGRTVRDMTAVDQAAGDVRRRYFGAAQIQILMSDDVPAAYRDQTFATLVGAMHDTIVAIGSGAAQ